MSVTLSPRPKSRFISTMQAAAYLGLSESNLRAMRKRPDGPPFHKFGSIYKYVAADLDAWAEARRHDQAGADKSDKQPEND